MTSLATGYTSPHLGRPRNTLSISPHVTSQAAESLTVLQKVLLPSLHSATVGRDRDVLQAVGSIQAGMVQLEKMVRILRPGSAV